MQIGMVGLGRMGGNMTRRLLEQGHQVVGYDISADNVREAASHGATGASSLDDLAHKLDAPRIIWLMVPAGGPVDDAIDGLTPNLSSGDLIIDGGNSRYTDSMRRAGELRGKGVHFMDVGVSGGIWGLKEGYCLMAGGNEADYARVTPILQGLAPEGGYAHVGKTGAGHFVKMVHNGVEYAMLEAYGEGFELLRSSEFKPDLHEVAALWLHGSVVRSWLLELAERAFQADPDLSEIRGVVEDSGEGRWTVQEAMNLSVPVPAIANALFRRFGSRQQESFSAKVIAALRHEFGGHRVEREDG